MIHTPGPWCIKHDFNVHGNNGRRLVANCGGHYSNINSEKIHNENISNAKLISAAPDLLDELKHLVKLLEPIEKGGLHIPGLATLNRAKAAISKAEGR